MPATFSMSFDPITQRRLAILAAHKGINRSELVRRIVSEAIDKARGNPVLAAHFDSIETQPVELESVTNSELAGSPLTEFGIES